MTTTTMTGASVFELRDAPGKFRACLGNVMANGLSHDDAVANLVAELTRLGQLPMTEVA